MVESFHSWTKKQIQQDEANDSFLDEDNDEDEDHGQKLINQPVKGEEPNRDEAEPSQHFPKNTDGRKGGKQAEKKRIETGNEQKQELMSSLSKFMASRAKQSVPKTEDEIFGNMVAMQMSKLSGLFRAQAQHEINNSIFKYIMAQERSRGPQAAQTYPTPLSPSFHTPLSHSFPNPIPYNLLNQPPQSSGSMGSPSSLEGENPSV